MRTRTFSQSVLALALFMAATNILMGIYAPGLYLLAMTGELGIVENAQALILMVAGLMAAWMSFRARHRGQKAWLALIAVATFCILGEEISWGQHYMGWYADGWFASHNDQLETNLHNTSSWLDQKPRFLLLTALYVGGILLPLCPRLTTMLKLPHWMLPVRENLPLALLVMLSGLPKMVEKADILPFSINIQNLRYSELQELLLYLYFIAYLGTFLRSASAK